MHVGVITYQRGHLKTWQILKKLLVKPFRITLFAFPFALRPQVKYAFQDRPDQLIDLDIKKFCADRRIGYVEVGGWEKGHVSKLGDTDDSESPNAYLTCIAKIIPETFLEGRIIINAHPGLLPENRGLDAFKWSIANGWPVGVSLHVVNRHIDRGILLHRVRVPILQDDTLPDVAKRAYELECDLQANFEHYLPRLKHMREVSDEYPLSKRRIPSETDRKLNDIFIRQRDKLVMLSNMTDELYWDMAIQ